MCHLMEKGRVLGLDGMEIRLVHWNSKPTRPRSAPKPPMNLSSLWLIHRREYTIQLQTDYSKPRIPMNQPRFHGSWWLLGFGQPLLSLVLVESTQAMWNPTGLCCLVWDEASRDVGIEGSETWRRSQPSQGLPQCSKVVLLFFLGGAIATDM